MSAFLVGCAVLTVHIFVQLSELRSTSASRPGYELAQLEMKHVRLLAAADAFRYGGLPEYTEVLRCFQFFYEHIQMLREEPGQSSFAGDANADAALARVSHSLDEMKPLIDGPADILVAQLGQVLKSLNGMHGFVHQITDAGLKAAAEKSEAVSVALADRLRLLALVAMALIATLALLTVKLWRLYRTFKRHARTNRTDLGRLKTILDTALDAIVVVNASGDILQANSSASAFFVLTEDSGAPRNISDVLFRREENGETSAISGALLMKSCANGPNRCAKVLMKAQDSTLVPVEMSAALARQDEETVVICYLRDISRRLRAETDMKEARDRALAGERAQARFLAMISHEMRTPLTGIVGTLDLLDETELTQEQQSYVTIVQAAAQQMLIQTNDALDLTQAGAGKLSLSRDAFDLDELLDEVLDSHRTEARNRGTHLHMRHLSGQLGYAIGDRARVLQVLNNLISNAVKFTKQGHVWIEVSRDDPRSDWVEFQVSDNGIGIPDADQDRIFDDFVRLRVARDNDAPGTGLGLGIVRELVARMKGEVGVESTVGEGSLFWIRLPLKACRPHSVARVPSMETNMSRDKLRILLAEDNAANGFVLCEMLRKDGHLVTYASCGQSAVREAKDSTFDLILMDMRMPGLDGIGAARQIRKGDGLSAQARLVFLTAHVENGSTAHVRNLEAEAIIAKPLRRDALRDVVAGRTKKFPLKNSSASDITKTQRTFNGNAVGKPATDLVDPKVMKQLRDALSHSDLGRMIDQFDREAARFFVELPEWRERPAEQLAEQIHDFAGSAATFGAIALQQRLGAAEEALRGMQVERAGELIALLPQLWKETRIALGHEPVPT
ncbi:MAG: ATP-binding protein [Pseudomonadota bacterium]